LQTSGAAAAGLVFATPGRPAGAATQTLALSGGSPAITAPQGDAAKWPLYGKAEEAAVLEVLYNPDYKPLDDLEADWRKYLGVPHAKSHCNGTSALTTMFFALDLPPGSEILVPSYTFFATIAPMRFFGLVPVFVDIDPYTLNLDLEDAKKRLTPNTKAILPVHWIGLPCEMDRICDWAKEKGLIVLEDAAHAHGARLQDKLMGTWGRMSIFSFQTTKPLPGIEGGMGVYQDQTDFDRASALGDYKVPGVDPNGDYAKYNGSGLGLKFRMHPMAAVLVQAQLKDLDARNRAGVAQVRKLNDRLVQLPGLYEQTTGRKDMERIHYSWNMMFIDEQEAGMTRAQAVAALKAEGVVTSEFSYTLQHKLPLYSEAQWWHHAPAIPDLPGSEKANQVALPLPYWTSERPDLVEQYVAAFEKVWAHRKEIGKA
jgi:dTDP-4-amino-4,6-dideoxygalactose transaminase